MQDQHIPNLLAFHPSVRFTEDPLYISGKIILQDKASCFPAHVLSPPARENAVVIDATSAPGNKTSHLCAIMQNKGKVSALWAPLYALRACRALSPFSSTPLSATGNGTQP